MASACGLNHANAAFNGTVCVVLGLTCVILSHSIVLIL